MLVHSARVVHYDPFSADAMVDPFPVYRALRDAGPIHHLAEYDTFALPRFEEVWQIAQERRSFSILEGPVFSREQLLVHHQGAPAPPPAHPLRSFSTIDPPAHTAVRQWLYPSFTPRACRDLSDEVDDLVRTQIKRSPSRAVARRHLSPLPLGPLFGQSVTAPNFAAATLSGEARWSRAYAGRRIHARLRRSWPNAGPRIASVTTSPVVLAANRRDALTTARCDADLDDARRWRRDLPTSWPAACCSCRIPERASSANPLSCRRRSECSGSRRPAARHATTA
jgi:cytochrome P450